MSEYTLVKQKYDEWVKAQEGWRTKEIDPFDAFTAGWDACTEEDVSK
jgi:hypothetical protein